MAAGLFRIKFDNVLEFKELVGVSDIFLLSVACQFICASVAYMFNYFQWNFTLGLSLSSLVDVMVTVTLFVLLQKSRTGADT